MEYTQALSPQARIEVAGALLKDTQTKAAGRSLTNNQGVGVASAVRAINDAVDDLKGGASEYVRRMAADALRAVGSDDPEQAIQIGLEVAKVAKFDALRAAGDPFAANRRPVIERSGNSSADPDWRAIISDAQNGNARALEFNPGYATRALGTATGVIETTFADQFTIYERNQSPLVDPGVVSVVARSSGAPYAVPRLTADAAAGGTTTAEAGAITLLDPTVGAVTITPAKRAVITKVSSELLEDADYDLSRIIAESSGRAIGIAVGTALTATLLAGISNGGTASGTATYGSSATFWGWGDLATLYSFVAAPYRAKGSWLVSTDAFAKLWQLRDNNNQPAIFSMGAQSTPTLFGRPVYVDPGLAAVGSASKSVVFGDLGQALTVVRRTPLRVEVSRDAYFSTDEVGVRVIDRSAGAVIDAAAAAYLVSANT